MYLAIHFVHIVYIVYMSYESMAYGINELELELDILEGKQGVIFNMIFLCL